VQNDKKNRNNIKSENMIFLLIIIYYCNELRQINIKLTTKNRLTIININQIEKWIRKTNKLYKII
jgi:hypothetical protein